MILIVFALMISPAHAAVIDLGQAFGAALQPYIDALVNALILAGVGWVSYVFKSKLNVDIDAQHREALTAFLQRQASSLIADGRVKLNGTRIEVSSDAVARAAMTASTAIPGALAHFGLTPAKLSDLIVDALPKIPSVAQAQAVALDAANPATPSVQATPPAKASVA